MQKNIKILVQSKELGIMNKKKAAAQRYRKSEAGRMSAKRCQKRYTQSPAGKIRSAEDNKKYRSTIKGHLRNVFNGMRQRCTNPKVHNYYRYGGRGIKVLFESANEFINYVVNELQVDPRGLTIDRIDNDNNYERGNIRFVTMKVNRNNRGDCKTIERVGENEL